jgi:hypothetical protein
LNSRVNFRLSMTHLRFHQNTKLGVFGTGYRPTVRAVIKKVGNMRMKVYAELEK